MCVCVCVCVCVCMYVCVFVCLVLRCTLDNTHSLGNHLNFLTIVFDSIRDLKTLATAAE